jgi:hypothetical protein
MKWVNHKRLDDYWATHILSCEKEKSQSLGFQHSENRTNLLTCNGSTPKQYLEVRGFHSVRKASNQEASVGTGQGIRQI